MVCKLISEKAKLAKPNFRNLAMKIYKVLKRDFQYL